MELSLEVGIRYQTEDGSEDAVQFFDGVYDELRALGARRVWMSLDEADRSVDVAFTLDWSGAAGEGLWTGHSALRTALHAAGGATPNWTQPSYKVEEVKDADSHREQSDGSHPVPG